MPWAYVDGVWRIYSRSELVDADIDPDEGREPDYDDLDSRELEDDEEDADAAAP